MNEFLKNLRSGMDKQQQQNRYRRPYDKSQTQYRGSERRSNERRNKDHQPKPNVDFLEPLLNDLIASIRQLINESLEVRNTLEERKTNALEQISENLQTLIDMVGEGQAEDAGLVFPGRISKNRDENRDRVLQIIKDMRAEGATYDQIASQLESENLPTFSGRGKWHAQTVHRIHSTHLPQEPPELSIA